MKLISEAQHQRQTGCEANGVVNHDLAPSLSLLITKQALKKMPVVHLGNLDIVRGQDPFSYIPEAF